MNNSTIKWNLKKPDWPLFSNLLEKKINSSEFTDDHIDIETTVSKFTKTVIETAEQTIGYIKPPFKKTPVPWWNNEIKQSISQKNKALKTFIKTRSLEDHIKLKELRAKTRFLVKSSKTITWRNFTSNLGAQTDPHIMWNKIRSLQGRKKHNNIYLSTNSSLNTDPSSIAHLLGKYFEKNSSNEMYSHDFLRQNMNLPPAQPSSISPQNAHQTYLNSPITIDEILQALKKCTSKSTGPDNIPYSFIQNFSSDTLQVLLKIYNTIWNKNVFPQNWRNSIVIPISKPGKNKFSPEGYRPISLLNTLCKVLEKIDNQRLIWFIEQSNYLSPAQCGFRKNKGTYNCLSKIHTEIQNTYSENQYLGMISLDLMKAYDTTWKPHILNSLNKVLSQNQLFNFISNFLKTRTFQVRINQTLSNTFSQANGVPQGSTISVTLFLIAINNITQNISPPVYSTLYADDFNIYCRSKSLATVQTHLQQAINNLIKWTLTSGFTFSPEKSQCTVFTRKRIQNFLNIKIGDYQLINNSTIKILGITFDKRCSWTHHINSLKNSTSPRLNIIKMLSHSSWGSKTHVLLTVYKSLILSKLDYGSFLWTTANKSNTKKLDTIHNAGLRMSIGAYRSSPIPSIYNLAGTPPLEIRRLKITLNHELKLASTLPSLDFNPKFKTLSILLQENNLAISNLLTISPPLAPQWTNPNVTNTELSILKKKDTSSSTYKQEYFHLIQNIKSEKMYTDASVKTKSESELQLFGIT